MFEMKNERSVTKSKHKNEDFLKELDKDRKEKKCEYAVCYDHESNDPLGKLFQYHVSTPSDLRSLSIWTFC